MTANISTILSTLLLFLSEFDWFSISSCFFDHTKWHFFLIALGLMRTWIYNNTQLSNDCVHCVQNNNSDCSPIRQYRAYTYPPFCFLNCSQDNGNGLVALYVFIQIECSRASIKRSNWTLSLNLKQFIQLRYKMQSNFDKLTRIRMPQIEIKMANIGLASQFTLPVPVCLINLSYAMNDFLCRFAWWGLIECLVSLPQRRPAVMLPIDLCVFVLTKANTASRNYELIKGE